MACPAHSSFFLLRVSCPQRSLFVLVLQAETVYEICQFLGSNYVPFASLAFLSNKGLPPIINSDLFLNLIKTRTKKWSAMCRKVSENPTGQLSQSLTKKQETKRSTDKGTPTSGSLSFLIHCLLSKCQGIQWGQKDCQTFTG